MKRGYGSNLRTGLLTPPGESLSSSLYSVSERSMGSEHPRHVLGEIGDYHIGAGAPDPDEGLSHDALLVDPSVGRGRLDHGVLAGDLVGGQRKVEAVRRLPYDVQIGACGLDHYHIGALGDIELDLAHGLPPVAPCHLVSGTVPLPGSRFRDVPEGAVVGGLELGAVRHDRNAAESGVVERLPDGGHLPVHHPAGGDDVRSGLRLGDGGPGVELDRVVVDDMPASVEDAAVPVVCVLAEAQVRYHQEIGALLQAGDRLLHDSVPPVGSRSDGVLLRGDPEHQDGSDPALLYAGRDPVEPGQGMRGHPRHGVRGSRLGQRLVEEHREDQLVLVETRLAHQVPDPLILPQPPEAHFRVHHCDSSKPKSSAAASQISVRPSREASLRFL